MSGTWVMSSISITNFTLGGLSLCLLYDQYGSVVKDRVGQGLRKGRGGLGKAES